VTLFLFTFFLLYGGMHFYAFMKAKAALAFGVQTSIYVTVFMIIMVFAPFIIRVSERAGFEFFARLMSYIGYTWLGVLFLFTSASLAIDVYRIVLHAGGFMIRRDLSYLTLSNKYAFLIPLIIAMVTAAYGYFEAKDIRTEEITIRSPKIPAGIGRLRIVQISDVHIGLIIGEDRIKCMLEEVRKAKPDILVSTGDLVDGQMDALSGLADLLKEVNPRFGKFAITGNHEFYAGLDHALNFTERAGFKMLRGEKVDVAGITIAGVDDPQGKAFGLFKGDGEQELLSGVDHKKFVLLLKHRPLVDKGSLGLFDLQLSGHVHKGQIFPFSIVTGLYYPTQAGFANLPRGSELYVSRGTGTWGPPIRFLAPPEVTVIDLVHEDK
jgi:predicted MPP superfamily phosphohydrolase